MVYNIDFNELNSQINESTKLLKIESINSSEYFEFLILFQNLPFLNIFWDFNQKKYIGQNLLCISGANTFHINQSQKYKNLLYVGLLNGNLNVFQNYKSASINSNNYVVRDLPNFLKSQKLKVSCILSTFNNIIVNYIGFSDDFIIPSFSVIYSFDFNSASIFTDVLYFISPDDNSNFNSNSNSCENNDNLYNCNQFFSFDSYSLNINPSISILTSSFSPDIEFISQNHKIVFYDVEKFTSPVTCDFKQTVVLATDSVAIETCLFPNLFNNQSKQVKIN